jgi:mitogen-activated protein kinase 1/3/mitogen-activated protein kinase 6
MDVINNNTTEENKNSYLVIGSRFDIDKRYEIVEPVGSGAYGLVVAATDTDTQ